MTGQRSPRLQPLGKWQKIVRCSIIGVWLVLGLITVQSVLLMAGAWRNDYQIEHHLGTARAEVLSAGPRRSTIEFVTPDRVTHRPELGVLYPSELAQGMRIEVEYDQTNPDLVRVQQRNASLAIIPAASIAVVSWIVGAIVLTGLLKVQRRIGG